MEEKEIEVRIYENILKSKRYIGFRLKNIIEGMLMASVVVFIILQIPFVPRIKIIFCIILGLTVFLLCCVGLKGLSPSELVFNIIAYIKTPRTWHLRSIKYAKRRNKQQLSQENVYTNQSAAEKLYTLAKRKYREFKEHKEIH